MAVEGYLWSMKEQCVVRWLEHPPEGLWATTGEWAVAAFSSVRRRRAEYGPSLWAEVTEILLPFHALYLRSCLRPPPPPQEFFHRLGRLTPPRCGCHCCLFGCPQRAAWREMASRLGGGIRGLFGVRVR
jgi:hypothetical protein